MSRRPLRFPRSRSRRNTRRVSTLPTPRRRLVPGPRPPSWRPAPPRGSRLAPSAATTDARRQHRAPNASPSAAAAFPVTLTDDEGTAVEIATEPQQHRVAHPGHDRDPVRARRRRLASSPPTDVERLPGRGRRPARCRRASSRVDVEKIVGLEADLVIAGGLGFNATRRDRPAPRARHPGRRHVRPDVDDRLKDIELIGAAVGRARRGRATLTAAMRAEIDAISGRRRPSRHAAAGLLRIGYDATTGPIFAAGRQVVRGRDGRARRRRHRSRPASPNDFEISLEKLIDRRSRGDRPGRQSVLRRRLPRRSRRGPAGTS